MHRVALVLRLIAVIIIANPLTFPAAALADDTSSHVDNRTYLGTLVNTGHDNGYSESNPIGSDDVHYSWNLGRFFVSGYTRAIDNGGGNFTFLKNVGDTVSLDFVLDQSIDCLNSKSNLTISDDDNGYDERMGVAKQDFGRGALIIRQTDYQNSTHEPVVYVDYLSGKETGAETNVYLFEEGDYEVCLDYEIKDNPRQVGPVSVFPGYSDYKISLTFSVRNGNSMVYLFDTATGDELTSSAYTPNGFRLDLANSNYLDLDIQKEILNDSADGLVTDTRFNRPAASGEQYTEDGIYTITATNRYTNQVTTKKIYVGTDPVLKAYVATGMDIDEINNAVDSGATINDDGTLVSDKSGSNASPPSTSTSPSQSLPIVPVAIVIVVIIVIAVSVSSNRKRRAAALKEAELAAVEETESGEYTVDDEDSPSLLRENEEDGSNEDN